MKYHIIAFILGIIGDIIIGDPQGAPHPIRLIGRLIGFLEKKLNTGQNNGAFKRGVFFAVMVLAITTALTAAVIVLFYKISPYAGLAAEAALTYYILALRSLYDESMKVYKRLKEGDLKGAQKAVSMIVGRDTALLDDIAVAKAAVETVAENTSDGVIAPMIYTAVGGPVLGMLYKAVNTMDSMVGYKNERYLFFGRAAAKIDDVFNYIPSRVSAYLMIIVSAFLKGFSMKGAYKIYRRDRHKHSSPNAAQTESVCAGALGIRLAGDASYFGVVYKKPYIGDAVRPVEYEDIKRANCLMIGAALLCAAICALAALAVWAF